MIWDAEDRPPKPETATRRLGLIARRCAQSGQRDVRFTPNSVISYGPNVPDQFRRAAEIVDKVLRGTKPGGHSSRRWAAASARRAAFGSIPSANWASTLTARSRASSVRGKTLVGPIVTRRVRPSGSFFWTIKIFA